jgi:integrase
MKAEHKILNLEDRQALIEAFKGTRYYYPILMGFKTGMRLGELMGLKWSNVNFKEGYIDVNQQITRNGMSNNLKSRASYRKIYLDKETKDILLEMKGTEYTNEEFVFTEHTTVFRCMFKALEPHEISPHDLRHNHATDLLGVMNPADAAKRMGHTVAEYIRTYVHSSDDIQKQAVKNLPVLKSESNLNKSRNISRGKVIKLATRAT